MSQTFTGAVAMSQTFTGAVAMSQTFTGAAADWSEHSTSSFTADVISADSNPNQTNFTFNSTPPSGSNHPISIRTNRVMKPARKRPRVSRRTPTTLLSTSTSNFRAMVQRFTGGPSALGFGTRTRTAGIDHPQPRRITDQQALGVDGLGLISWSPSMYGNPRSGYSFQVQHQAAATHQDQTAYGGDASSDWIAKSDGGGDSRFFY